MNLQELLDELRGGLLRDTSDRVAGDNDQLWSDTRLVGYIDQAQRRFARRSTCLRDSTSPLTRIVTAAGVADYPLDPSIISVLSMRSLGGPGVAPDAGDLGRTSHAAHANRRLFDDEPWDVNRLPLAQPGRVFAFDTDDTMAEAGGSGGVVTVRLYPTPSTAFDKVVLQMRVVRLPALRLTTQNLGAIPEVPEDYHLDMLDYAAYLALRVVDHEAGDAARAETFRQTFEAHCREARLEIQRKTFAPQRWGFGGRGFSYDGN